jgi:tetratricopeptide (TPR) repeat protein
LFKIDVKMKQFVFRLSILVVLFFLVPSCQEEVPSNDRLGEAHLVVNGKKKALPHFERGLLLLHSFEYEDARTAFRQAQEIDPDFAMAYWGEAMTHNHPLWRHRDEIAAQDALKNIAPDPETRQTKVSTELEKDLLKAADILFANGPKVQRDQEYSDFLAGLYQKHPGNQEVAAFYALSLLGAVPVGRDVEAYEKSASIAESILKENPNHPGALHYLIHSYDDPDHAVKALQAAKSYSRVAPDAAHALHMPSHIFVAMGMWDEVIASNIASFKASETRMREKDLDTDARSYHALHWLQYGYLQQGKWEQAEQLTRDMYAYMQEVPSKGARSYMIAMQGAYLIESGDWDSEIADYEVDLSDLNIARRSRYHYTRGHRAYLQKDAKKLSEVIDTLKSNREDAARQVSDTGVPMCSAVGKGRSAPNVLDVSQSEIMEHQLRALLADLNGDRTAGYQEIEASCQLEERISYSYGPPEIMKPTQELYGDWLLADGRVDEALNAYQKALQRGPNRLYPGEKIKTIEKEKEVDEI